MTTAIRRRRGTTAQHSTFIGLEGETTIDTDKEVVVVHDGTTQGGFPLMRESGSNSALALGSQGTPSLKFTGDPNTGIYSPGADQVAISTGGSGRLFVDASGNVGVGVAASATNRFYVSGSGTGALIRFVNTDSFAGGNNFTTPHAALIAGTGATGDVSRLALVTGGQVFLDAICENGTTSHTSLAFRTRGADNMGERLRITSAGLVGVGTSSPGALLHLASATGSATPTPTELRIATTTSASDWSTTDPWGRISYYSADASAGGPKIQAAIDVISSGAAGTSASFDFKLASNLDATLNSVMRINYLGQVGIGTSSPTGLLTVAASAPAIDWTNSSNTAFKHTIEAGNYSSTAANNTFAFKVASGSGTQATIMTLNGAGNVGIGVASPGARLHVRADNSDTIADLLRLEQFNAASTDSARLIIQANAANNEIIYNSTGQNTGAHVFQRAGTESVRIDSSGRLLVGTSIARSNFAGNTTTSLVQIEGVTAATASSSVVRGAADSTGPTFNLGKTRGASVGLNTAVVSGDQCGVITFQGADGTNLLRAAQIEAVVDNGADGTALTGSEMPGRLVFSTTADGASSPTERMRINNAGDILFVSSANKAGIDAGTVDGKYFSSTGARLISSRSATTAVAHQIFINGNGQVGSITTDGSATSYVTSSDYRLKENIISVADGIVRLKQLKPSRFNFIADPTKTVDGFIAHEVQDVVPEAITGEKDAVDEDGNPQYQGIDQSKLVPLLTAALQEAIGRIESLEAEVAALKAQ